MALEKISIHVFVCKSRFYALWHISSWSCVYNYLLRHVILGFTLWWLSSKIIFSTYNMPRTCCLTQALRKTFRTSQHLSQIANHINPKQRVLQQKMSYSLGLTDKVLSLTGDQRQSGPFFPYGAADWMGGGSHTHCDIQALAFIPSLACIDSIATGSAARSHGCHRIEESHQVNHSRLTIYNCQHQEGGNNQWVPIVQSTCLWQG